MKKLYQLNAVTRVVPLLILILGSFTHLQAQRVMHANLFARNPDNSLLHLDANATVYDNAYSNEVDYDDAQKMINAGENLAILRSNTNLVIEARQAIGLADTSFFRMWNLQQRRYVLQIVTEEMSTPGLTAVVKDNYLNTTTNIPLNSTVNINFTVDTDAASGAPDRFQLRYQNILSAPLPVRFTSISGLRKASAVQLQWNIQDEVSMESYTIERAGKNMQFQAVQQISAASKTTYSYTDVSAPTEEQFYRVKATSRNGFVQYSAVIRLEETVKAGVQVHLTQSGRTVNVELKDGVSGRYHFSLVSANGIETPLLTKEIAAGNTQLAMPLPAGLTAGIYYIRMINPGRVMKTTAIQVL
ncbi:MAG: type sorting protein [Ferruginibacter sp.]|nr:type sorting protein [Ferruginibacter sp.]